MSRYADVKKVTMAALGANHHGNPGETRDMLAREATHVLEETSRRLGEIKSQIIDELTRRAK